MEILNTIYMIQNTLFGYIVGKKRPHCNICIWRIVRYGTNSGKCTVKYGQKTEKNREGIL